MNMIKWQGIENVIGPTPLNPEKIARHLNKKPVVLVTAFLVLLQIYIIKNSL